MTKEKKKEKENKTVKRKQDPSVTNVIATESDFTDKPLLKALLRSTLTPTSKTELNGVPATRFPVDDSSVLHSCFLSIDKKGGNIKS